MCLWIVCPTATEYRKWVSPTERRSESSPTRTCRHVDNAIRCKHCSLYISELHLKQHVLIDFQYKTQISAELNRKGGSAVFIGFEFQVWFLVSALFFRLFSFFFAGFALNSFSDTIYTIRVWACLIFTRLQLHLSWAFLLLLFESARPGKYGERDWVNLNYLLHFVSGPSHGWFPRGSGFARYHAWRLSLDKRISGQ